MDLIPPSDAMFLMGESREHPMHVGGLHVYQLPEGAGENHVSDLYHTLLKYTDIKHRLTLRPHGPVSTLGQVMWGEDSDVDLEYHVRLSALPRPGRVRELLETVSRLHGALLDRHRPMWEFYLIEGLEGGRFATYTKLHHSLYDGVGATGLMSDSLSEDPNAIDCLPFWAATHEDSMPRERSEETAIGRVRSITNSLGRVSETIGTTAGLVASLARMATQTRDLDLAVPFSAPRTILNRPITGSRRVAADFWPMSRLKKAGAPIGATLNDVVLAMCAGALRRYLLELDALPAKPLVASVPVSLRGLPGAGDDGNAVGLVACSLATHLDDPHERMAAIRASMDKAKAQLNRQGAAQTQLLTSALGTAAVLLSIPGLVSLTPPMTNLVISNVPGPRKLLYWNGAKLEGTYPLSIPVEGQALNITCLSYAGHLHFGLTGCRTSLPHLQRLLGHLEDSLAELER